MNLNLPLSYFVWTEEYCQTSPNKNKSPNLWHVTSILVCCMFGRVYIYKCETKFTSFQRNSRQPLFDIQDHCVPYYHSRQEDKTQAHLIWKDSICSARTDKKTKRNRHMYYCAVGLWLKSLNISPAVSYRRHCIWPM